MMIRASLHNHTKEDAIDGKIISYSIYDLIDEASEKKIQVIALTGHEKYVCRQEYKDYAASRGVLLISGIELTLFESRFRKPHMLILNCDSSIECVKDLEDLRSYKESNPEVFIIAPHPFFDPFNSISKRNLIRNIDIFDAIEHSWFYSAVFNPNGKVLEIAKRYDKPFISTADVHFLEYLERDFIELDISEISEKEVFSAIREFRYRNKTAPKRLAEMIAVYLRMTFLNLKAFFR